MELLCLRYKSEDDYTDGMLFIDDDAKVFTIEDEKRTVKVFGETRVPDGRFKVALRREGSFHERYTKKFNHQSSRHFISEDWHQGMLCIYNYDNWVLRTAEYVFQYILIHIGNDDDDTAGCLLTGMTQSMDDAGFIGQSTDAYKLVYPAIRDACLQQEANSTEEVFITYKTIG